MLIGLTRIGACTALFTTFSGEAGDTTKVPIPPLTYESNQPVSLTACVEGTPLTLTFNAQINATGRLEYNVQYTETLQRIDIRPKIDEKRDEIIRGTAQRLQIDARNMRLNAAEDGQDLMTLSSFVSTEWPLAAEDFSQELRKTYKEPLLISAHLTLSKPDIEQAPGVTCPAFNPG